MGIVLINQEKNRTEKERLRAQQTLQEMSPRAIDGWLSRLIGKLEPAQEEFLKRALTNYLDFAQESGQSEEVRRGVAEAHRRVGEIRLILGQNRAAEEAVAAPSITISRSSPTFPKPPITARDWPRATEGWATC